MARSVSVSSDKPKKKKKNMGRGENLKPYHFKKGQSGNPSGRFKIPKELRSKVHSVKMTMVETVCDCLLSAKSIEKIQANDNATPLEKYIAHQIVLCVSKGEYDRFDALMSRAFGKPKEELDMNVKGKMGELELIVQRSREKLLEAQGVTDAEFKEVKSEKDER